MRSRRLLPDIVMAMPKMEAAAWRAPIVLWVGVYVLFTARAAAIGAVVPGSNPWPALHAVIRLGLCGFGAALSWGIHEALNCRRYRSDALRWNVATILAGSGAALFSLLSVAACWLAFGIAACEREIANAGFLNVLIFAGWSIYSVAPSSFGRAGDDTALPAAPSVAALWVHERGRRYRVPASEILWVSAERECARIHTSGGSHLIRGSLRGLSEVLGPDFIRIHRSAIVRADAVMALQSCAAGMGIELADGTRLPVGRGFRATTRSAFKGP